MQTAWLARFGRAVATETVDALGDRIERRAQARSGSGNANLSLLTSFMLASAGGYGGGGYGATGYGADHGSAGYGTTPGGTATGSPHAWPAPRPG